MKKAKTILFNKVKENNSYKETKYKQCFIYKHYLKKKY